MGGCSHGGRSWLNLLLGDPSRSGLQILAWNSLLIIIQVPLLSLPGHLRQRGEGLGQISCLDLGRLLCLAFFPCLFPSSSFQERESAWTG